MDNFINKWSLVHENFVNEPCPEAEMCDLLNSYFSVTKHCHNAFDKDVMIESLDEKNMYIELCYQCRLDLVTRTVLEGFYDQ